MEYIPSDTVIGDVMRKHREATDPMWTQTDLANRLRQRTGNPWDQSKVSDAEHGRYAFTVADLIAIGYIFGVPPIRFLHADIETNPELRVMFGNLRIRQDDILNIIIQGRQDRPKDRNRLIKGIDPDVSTLRERILATDDSDAESSRVPQDLDALVTELNKVPVAVAALAAEITALRNRLLELEEGDANGVNREKH